MVIMRWKSLSKVDLDKYVHTNTDYTCCQVLIPDTMVSRRHAVVSFRNGRYYLKDLGSSNGTLVNDVRVALDDEVEVGHGTVVQVNLLTI